MKKIFLLIMAACVWSAPACAQNTPGGGGTISGTVTTQGTSADGAPVSGNPNLIAGSDGTNARAVKVDANGGISAFANIAPASGFTNIATVPAVNNHPLAIYPFLFNGSSWDPQYYCASSAVVNVTNGTTAQLVALTAGQTIRVCGIVLTSTAATTATLSYGTGTTCGTGNTALSGAMALGASTAPLTINLGADGALRTASANALCLAAGATTVTGFITFAKY